MTLKVMATLSPAIRYGSECGMRTRSRILLRLAPTDRISATNDGSTDCRPASMSIATGKNAMTTISKILGARSKPNQRIKIGASATFGTFWNSTISG